MASRDYILCKSCSCKLVYDGYDNIRESLDNTYGTMDLICPKCLAEIENKLQAAPEVECEPVGVVVTIGGYPDHSMHTVEWLVKHKDLKHGDYLYKHQPAITDDVVAQIQALKFAYVGDTFTAEVSYNKAIDDVLAIIEGAK